MLLICNEALPTEDGGYDWPAGVYLNSPEHGFEQTLMGMETHLGKDGVTWRMPDGTDAEIENLRASYAHLTKLRDEVIEMGVLPPLSEWSSVNPNL